MGYSKIYNSELAVNSGNGNNQVGGFSNDTVIRQSEIKFVIVIFL